MTNAENREGSQERTMEVLSSLMVATYCGGEDPHNASTALIHEARRVAAFGQQALHDFLELANTNHVVVRVSDVLKKTGEDNGMKALAGWCEEILRGELARVNQAVATLHRVCVTLESRGCPVTVIKSLDHWPDLGSDLDLYTSASAEKIQSVMREEFRATAVARSWGDRLANKWNFAVPGLPELIEVHVQYLGQTGEHARLAKRVIERRVLKVLGEYQFHVPAPEERIIISTLQRVYRHFYFRLCDMIDYGMLLRADEVDFSELRKAANAAGIWPGVATFLCLIEEYLERYRGSINLPEDVLAFAHVAEPVRYKAGFLRFSKASAASLYGSQLWHAGVQRDLRALARLPLLPPLAVSAMVAYRLTGNDKGIW